MSKKLLWLIIIYVGGSAGILLMNDASSVQTFKIMSYIFVPLILVVFIYERKTGKR